MSISPEWVRDYPQLFIPCIPRGCPPLPVCLKPSYVHYRPQRSCGQGNIFTPVCHSVHGGGGGFCLNACWDTTPPDQADPPRSDITTTTTPSPPPGTRQTPPDQTPPGTWQTPPPETDSSIRSTSGRYASYWNAFLLLDVFQNITNFAFVRRLTNEAS